MTLYRVTALDCHYQPLEGVDAEAGDVDTAVVVRVPLHWGTDDLQRTSDFIRQVFPDRQVIIINEAVTFMRLEPVPEDIP